MRNWRGRGTSHPLYLLFILTAIYGVQFLDRQILVILIEPIKAEFGLSDSQVGVLAGLAFALPNALMLLPFGYLADRFDRRKILSVALMVWSALTALTAQARNFTDLFLIRAFVGAAEAANHPTALSMLSDQFTGAARGTAIGVFYSGIAIATIFGYASVGLIATHWGWRAAFILAGVPGLLLAALLLATREPQRPAVGTDPRVNGRPPSFVAALRMMSSQRSVVHLLAAMAVGTVSTAGYLTFSVPLLTRSHDVSLQTAAVLIGTVYGSAAAVGMMLGGPLFARIQKDSIARLGFGAAIAMSLTATFMAAGALTSSLPVCVATIGLWALSNGLTLGPIVGAVQSLVPATIRGTSGAVVTLLVNFVGAGMGPLVVGLLSDARIEFAPGEPLRGAMASIALGQIWASVHMLKATSHLNGDLRCTEMAERSSENRISSVSSDASFH